MNVCLYVFIFNGRRLMKRIARNISTWTDRQIDRIIGTNTCVKKINKKNEEK